MTVLIDIDDKGKCKIQLIVPDRHRKAGLPNLLGMETQLTQVFPKRWIPAL